VSTARPGAESGGRLDALGAARRALAQLKRLVVRDLVEVESASFWRDVPEVKSGELNTEDIGITNRPSRALSIVGKCECLPVIFRRSTRRA
jgi:hypothetical protein